MPKETLSASKIKTLKSCSWLYWCKYHLKLPDKTNDGALKGEIVHLVFECLGKERHRKHYDNILKKKNPLPRYVIGKNAILANLVLRGLGLFLTLRLLRVFFKL